MLSEISSCLLPLILSGQDSKPWGNTDQIVSKNTLFLRFVLFHRQRMVSSCENAVWDTPMRFVRFRWIVEVQYVKQETILIV